MTNNPAVKSIASWATFKIISVGPEKAIDTALDVIARKIAKEMINLEKENKTNEF